MQLSTGILQINSKTVNLVYNTIIDTLPVSLAS